MSIFQELDLEALQRMLGPVIIAVGGPDVQGFLSSKSNDMHAIADGLSTLAGICDLAGDALEDGVISNDEFNAIVFAAGTIDEAYAAILAAVKGIEVEE